MQGIIQTAGFGFALISAIISLAIERHVIVDIATFVAGFLTATGLVLGSWWLGRRSRKVR